MNRRIIEILVGVFVVLGLLAMLFLALKAGNLATASTGPSYRLYARFDNIGGLKARAPVRSAGVNVGRVGHISLDRESFQGVVTLDIQTQYQFPRDSSVKILTNGLLGDQYVGIDPGGDEKNFEAGAIITRTQSAIVLENLIGQFLFSRAADAGASAAASPVPALSPSASGAKP